VGGITVSTLPRKDAGIAALIAGLGGLFLFGLGHFYVGKIGRGVVFLVVGLLLKIPLIWLIPIGMLSVLFGSGEGFAALALLGLLNLVLWIAQIYDPYHLAKEYNAALESTSKPPW
jgi:TM2 domain-containing membrane protein YozV